MRLVKIMAGIALAFAVTAGVDAQPPASRSAAFVAEVDAGAAARAEAEFFLRAAVAPGADSEACRLMRRAMAHFVRAAAMEDKILPPSEWQDLSLSEKDAVRKAIGGLILRDEALWRRACAA